MSKALIPSTLTTQKVATMLGVSLRTVQLWANKGILEYARTPGGHRRFTNQSVQTFRQSWVGSDRFKDATPVVDLKQGVALVGLVHYVKWITDTEQQHCLIRLDQDGSKSMQGEIVTVRKDDTKQHRLELDIIKAGVTVKIMIDGVKFSQHAGSRKLTIDEIYVTVA